MSNSVDRPVRAESAGSLSSRVDVSRGLGVFVIVAGVVGGFASTQLVIEKIHYFQALAEGKKATTGCDINAFVSCGAVINTDQASLFGFPNPVIGMIMFPALVVFGVLMVAGIALPRWMWAGLQVGVVLAAIFITWLQTQSIYEINALCPWCMVVWTMVIPLTVLITAQNLRTFAPQAKVTAIVSDWTLLIILLWYVVVIAAIWFVFGSRLWA